ncbi:MAG: hypothetical protein EON88_21285, partial [Brevundimonas sp.]
MCVLALAWQAHPGWRLVLAANRDERHDRASAPLARWTDAPTVLGGRDLVSGGTWLGVSNEGRLAVVTNLHTGAPPDPQAPSRGQLLKDLLTGTDPALAPSSEALATFIRGYVQPEPVIGATVLYIEDSRVVAEATKRM